jgi:uncharacterized protein YcfJ
MKGHWGLAILTALGLSSCENKTATGMAVGAGVGALGGGLIAGNATGALIGGGIGLVGGGLIGYSLDEQDRQTMQQQSPQTLQRIDHGQPLTTEDIKAMSKAGINDDVIISQIQSTGTVFQLSTDQIIDLKNSGVSQKVIDYMVETGIQH